jgi:hypothetical protein
MVDAVEGHKAGQDDSKYGDVKPEVTLKIDWLDEKGKESQPSPVTRIVRVSDPSKLTPWLYVEETAIRIIAVDKNDHIVTKVSGAVRLDEMPNRDFPQGVAGSDWRFSYKGELQVATGLQPARSSDGENTSIKFLEDTGSTDVIRLRSLAGPRRREDSPDKELYARNWDALLTACEAVGKPCGAITPTIFGTGYGAVGQWVDQETYSPRASNGEFTHKSGGNGVRDWVEALAWDTLGDLGSAPSPMGQVAACLSPLSAFGEVVLPQSLPGHTPGEWSDDLELVYWYPQHFRDAALRRDGDYCGYRGDGFKVTQSSSIMSSVLIHEARHCWQRQIVVNAPNGQDEDSDWVPTAPEALDPMAIRLKDDRHVWVGGANPEMHFAGRDYKDFGLWRQQRERDAVYFEKRALDAIRPLAHLTMLSAPQLTGTLVTGTSLSLRVGSPVLDAIQIKGTMMYLPDFARCGDPQEKVYPAFARIVELSVLPSTGLSMMPQFTNAYSCNLGKCVAVTNADGVASIDLSARTPGTYTVSATLLDITPGCSTSTATGGSFTITVTVTP